MGKKGKLKFLGKDLSSFSKSCSDNQRRQWMKNHFYKFQSAIWMEDIGITMDSEVKAILKLNQSTKY